ncbi:sphingomyelin synthase-related protein 1-like isoform X2 [Syngnathoides biaculeatus]|uniref:sphingomyelin synthase-related protein 1-like isoform X2 n=1 Tax=Syngnathoides biaculeatus TaxID=300417 RepID=UPI002ADE05A2|nr:sphingomyelin synthase-related protein 1-like isoform X2 [Syngnathoides biaculeatus]
MASESSVSAWSCKQVAQWLQRQGFDDYVDLLCADHRLDGPSLLALTEADLHGPPLSLKVLGDIKRLAIALRQLQRQNQAQLEELGLQPRESLPQRPCVATGWSCDGGDRRCNRGECSGDGTELRLRNGTRSEYRYGGTQCHTHSNGTCRGDLAGRLDPEVWKTIISVIYVFLVFGFTSFVMVIVHERVPDMGTYPPLPDIFLDSFPRIPWAFAMAEACGLILCYMLIVILLLHKHRSILIRRLCSLMGTVFLLRCCTMFVTSLSVPDQHLKCASKVRSFPARSINSELSPYIQQYDRKDTEGTDNLGRIWDDSYRCPNMRRLHVQRSHCCHHLAQLFCDRIHSKNVEFDSHHLVGAEPLRDLLHPGCA